MAQQIVTEYKIIRAVLSWPGGQRPSFKCLHPPSWPQTQCQIVALCNVCARHYCSFRLAFSGADIELDFVLMTILERQLLAVFIAVIGAPHWPPC